MDHKIVPVDQLLPDELFIVPLKFRPIFPGLVTPLMIPPGPLAESVENVIKKSPYIGLLLQKDENVKELSVENLYSVGTAARVLKKMKLPDGGIQLLINTLFRFKVKNYRYTKPFPVAEVEYFREEDSGKRDKETQGLMRAIINNARKMANMNPLMTEEMKLTLVNVDSPGRLADFACNILDLSKEEYQEILETFDTKQRLEKSLRLLIREMEMLKLQQQIEGKITDKMAEQQREYFLREQLKQIRHELGLDKKPKEKDAEFYREKIQSSGMSEEAKEKALQEVEKLEYVEPSASEYSVIRNYLDLILDLPWDTPKFEPIDLKKAERILNRDHYGLEDVKQTILEILAVRNLTQKNKGNILCFVGPPGVGKTSLGKSIASAMKKKFYRFSLGGMRDEAEIKGHRRTYIGAMPGKFIQALRTVKTADPVIMLDEIDKLSSSYHGDPASALLEVLDPQQNESFLDHYLDIPFDLSHITFITTANTLDTIPAPLRDRMEIIRLSGYIPEEKVQIAKKYIIPRVMKDAGVQPFPKISNKELKGIIESYSREAGVRSLEKVFRKVARKFALAKETGKEVPSEITMDLLKEYVGPAYFTDRYNAKIEYPGCANGLAWTSLGGAVLPVEAKAVKGKGKFKVTGQLGKVMEESALIAYTYARSLSDDKQFWEDHDIHLHVPDGATPKDGPSAGVTIVTALLSLYRNKKVKQGFAMTGEVRLTGEVLPIGGLKEKLIAAKRSHIKHIIFPADNKADWEELPEKLKKGIQAHPVRHYHEIEKLLF
ncbi:MAG: endopeptidase La [Candidatus Hydrogenedentota bacterium]|nr:MAG: endopeptidase La [Candidatus Hydrogenedentota bacterium]